MTSDDDTTREVLDDVSADDEERTHLITFEDDEVEQRYADSAEPTHRIDLDAADSPRKYGDDAEPTRLIGLDDAGEDDEPTHLIELDAGAQAEADQRSSAQVPGIQREAAAVFGFDDHTPHPALDESIDLDIDESALRDEIRVSNSPSSDDDADDPDGDRSAVRQFTDLVRARAESGIVDTLQSPGRSLLAAFVAAGIVVVIGFFAVYSALAHAHLDSQIEEVERAIGADLYSSHLGALSEARRMQDHRVLPVGPVDTAVGAIVDRTPVLSPAEKREHATHLERYVEARLDYRFAGPATHLDADVEIAADDSELLAAADVYRRLSRHDHSGAVDAAQKSFAEGADEDLAILAYTDALAEAGPTAALRLLADTAPRDSAAQAYSAARLLAGLDRDDDAADLLRPFTGGDSPHIGAQIHLSRHDGDARSASELAAALDDPNHPHVSARERAHAQVAAAHTADDDSRRRDHLERAAELAPGDPTTVAPSIDYFLERGELHEARRLLAKVPSSDFPPPYFDVAAARLDILEGDTERAVERLEPHAFDVLDATAKLGVLRLLGGDLFDARALFDAVAERDEDLGDVLYAWLFAHRNDFDKATERLDNVDAPEWSPFFAALHAEAHRLSAGAAPERSRANELLDEARAALDESPTSPELRHQECLTALDRRTSEAAAAICSHLMETDVTIRHGVDAVVRFYRAEGDLSAAHLFLDDHVEQAGYHPTLDVLRADLHIDAGELADARSALDSAASRLHDTPQFHVAEGRLSIAHGRLDHAARHFQRAENATPIFDAAARLGRIQTAVLRREAGADDLANLDDLVDAVQPLLRHGELGPAAWTTFAALRRQQDRLVDASENLAIADRTRRDYGSTDERTELLLEEATLTSHRHDPGDRRIEPLLDKLEDLDAHHWRYHLLAARWHHRQRRPDTDRVELHLAEALRIAPDHCSVWRAKDDADASVDAGVERPDECR